MTSRTASTKHVHIHFRKTEQHNQIQLHRGIQKCIQSSLIKIQDPLISKSSIVRAPFRYPIRNPQPTGPDPHSVSESTPCLVYCTRYVRAGVGPIVFTFIRTYSPITEVHIPTSIKYLIRTTLVLTPIPFPSPPPP
jgi:hypothetical protein